VHYQHRYHAGNFADVFKHVLLCGLLEALSRKPAPWGYLETHAGTGSYDLGDDAAQRTGEWGDGIGKLWRPEVLATLPESFAGALRALNPDGPLRHYPGSPLLAQGIARDDDRIVLCERQAPVVAELRAHFAADARVAIHQRDGYEAYALLPPEQKRGVVLIDPPFERPDEFDAAADFVERAAARFAHGVYAFWHPVKNRHAAERGARRFGAGLGRERLRIAFDTGAPLAGRMYGCGMVILNPPFGFAQACEPWLRTLVRELSQGPRAGFTCEPG
jgi:23S rRNA (adenine2030-N6)-methyltransferase